MPGFRLDQLLEWITSTRVLVIGVWSGLAAVTLALVVLMGTRWGQSRPLGKCLVLSVIAHLLLAGYATTVRIVGASVPPEEPVVHVSLVEPGREDSSSAGQTELPDEPWEQFPEESVARPEEVDPSREPPSAPPDPERRIRAEPQKLPDEPDLETLAMAEAAPPDAQPSGLEGSKGRGSPAKEPEPIEVPEAQRRDPAPPAVPDIEAPSAPAPEDPGISRGPRTTGARTALVEHMGPLPRLRDVPVVPDPADALAGLDDRTPRPPRGTPAEPFHRATESASRNAGGVAPGDGGGLPGGVGRRYAPSASDMAGAYHGGGLDTGLPRGGADSVGPPRLPEGSASGGSNEMPSIYRLRVAPDRARRAQRHGATPESEAAVEAALRWLAQNQSRDGRWDASDHGGGRELLVAGRNRGGAGSKADTGMTGLALLAFLAAGHTHEDGPYAENVRRGLEYLLRVQGRDGNLAGEATTFARMYCHAMAAFALSEAYGMTSDDRLRRPVERAVAYTVDAQNPTTGGWRYSPRDPGDTSQLGWQWMALKSAELAGVSVPETTRRGVIKYLRSVSAGKKGGLASYRPGERVSPAMTAEAMVCWLFLGLPRTHAACDEAGDYLLARLPGQGEVNLYCWYYATLTMYQLQGAHWQRWNDALQKTLLDSQRKSGPAAGSWDPNSVWGGYGGRVYSTSLSALCLEVYYRFLPLYVEAAAAEREER